jgi:hypothetical protein
MDILAARLRRDFGAHALTPAPGEHLDLATLPSR